LDRSKPLWEIWFVEGLADGGFAQISKTHHALVDGVSGADLMTVILDLTPEPDNPEPEQWIPDPEPTPDQLVAEALRERITSPAELIRSAQSAAMDPRRVPNRIVEAARALGSFVGGTLDFAPESTINSPIGPHRRFETVLTPLDDLKQVKNALGGTVNDVVLAAASGGLRHLLKNRGERLEGLELRAMVPVSVRADQDRGAMGNLVAAMWAPLPVFEEDAVARLHWVSDKMQNLKSSGQAVGAQLLTSIGEWAPPTVLAQASRLVSRQRAYNLVITNVPGPQFPLYTMGHEMKEVYPVVPLTNNTSIGIALFSYNGVVCWGLLGDYDAARDLGALAEGIEKSVAELVAAAG
ncbi:MAG TPA: wax ester/triacylglycerol synthase family O-acyltransferase, partial [Actinomycetota bacterium]|nr:wax ester/triacylglycerol synthase family O-acyltransferase [Actinomycetota bacterium]